MKMIQPPKQPLPTAQEGQAMVIMALAMVILTGIVALAVDVGHTYQQRQQMQNMAVSAAEAGAYEAYGVALTPVAQATKDAKVFNAMRDMVSLAGYNVVNVNGAGTYATPPADPCAAGYASSSVYLQAAYVNPQQTPVGTVGGGIFPTPASGVGVKVLGLGGCVPAFFAPVLGTKNFKVSGSAQAGASGAADTPTPGGPATDTPVPTATNLPGVPTATGTSTALPTLTPTVTNTSTPRPTATSSPTHGPTSTATASPTVTDTPTADTTRTFTGFSPFMIYGTPPTMLYAEGSPSNPTGDRVTIFGNAGTWAADQYADSTQGLSGTPGGISVHDHSLEGCMDPSQTTLIINGPAYYNHGGVGHCGTPPNAGDTVAIPIVTDPTKNDAGCNGGYCESVRAIVNVNITVVDWPHVIQGYITSVVYDPYGIVQLPPVPTATNTATATAVWTRTPGPTSTVTQTPQPTATITPTRIPPLPS